MIASLANCGGEVRALMTEVQFVEIKPFASCCKELVVVYHIPSSIKESNKHYIALCEVGESSSEFTWVWAAAGKTVPLEQEGITIKWRKGKVTFASQVLPKLSDGREYYLMYCNEDGTILGKSRPFQFCTDSDEFSSIDLLSTPSDDVVTISMHRKKAPSTTGSEISLHSNDDDTMSFEILSEQRYSDTAGDKEKQEPEGQSVTSTVIPKGVNNRTTTKLTIEGSDTNTELTSSYKETKEYQNTSVEFNSNQEIGQLKNLVRILEEKILVLEEKLLILRDEMSTKDNIIEESQAENSTLKEQIALNALSNSTVLINSPKEENRENRILKKRVQDETKKSARLEELLGHKETKIAELSTKLTKIEQNTHTLQIENKRLIDQVHKLQTEQDDNATQIENEKLIGEVQKLQTELMAKQHNAGPTVGLPRNKATVEEIADLSMPVSGSYKTQLYLKLFRQDPFICHICNEVLPAHTQEFSRLNHLEHCKGSV